MAFDTSDLGYRDLVGRVVQSQARVVPFVGAGLNAYGEPSERLPLWRELVERLLAEGQRLGLIGDVDTASITGHLESGRYIAALDQVQHLLGEPTFRSVVRRELDDSGRPIPPAISELVAIGWSLIVTTNLDRFVSRAYHDRYQATITAIPGSDTHRLVAAFAGTEMSTETFLAKIHGDIDSPSSWRLTANHYRLMLQDESYLEALRHLFLKQVFFVGFGLQDDDFDLLLETIAKIYPGGAGQFFALLPKYRMNEPRVQQLVRDNGLHPIYYDVEETGPDDPYHGHRAVFECLEDLARTWALATHDVPVKLKYFPEPDPHFVGRDEEVERCQQHLLRTGGGSLTIVGLGGLGKTSVALQFVDLSKVEIVGAGFSQVFGCSFSRSDLGEFIQDIEIACLGPSTLPLPAKVDRLCTHLSSHPLLLVLDGLESVAQPDGQLRNPYVSRIISAVRDGGGSVLVTSRVPIQDPTLLLGEVIELAPLSRARSEEFLKGWGLNRLPTGALDAVHAQVAGHPLALRVIAGFLRPLPEAEAVKALEGRVVLEARDEVDPLRENRLAGILRSYLRLLDEDEISFMCSWSIFDGPAGLPIVEHVLGHDYVVTLINAPLVGQDLRPVISSLLQKRLLAISHSGQLTSHPTVTEFFSQMAERNGADLRPLHRRLATLYLSSARDQPETFEEMTPLLAACRHAAASSDWTLFHDTFVRRIMRQWEWFLTDNLGGWDEALDLALLALTEPRATGWPDPVLYPAVVARCMKHLGQTDESRVRYAECLRICATTVHPDTAMHINNFLTLLAWRGELDAASRLVAPNLMALSWIEAEWQRRWQIDHGLSSIGYLYLLGGEIADAERLFEASDRAWVGFDGEPIRVVDHYPLYRTEVLLSVGAPDYDAALGYLDHLRQIAVTEHWPEVVCRSHVQLAEVYRSRASSTSDPSPSLRLAQAHLESAGALTAGMVVAEVAIAHRLGLIKLEVERRVLAADSMLGDGELESLIGEASNLVKRTGLELASPELVAATGHLQVLAGDRKGAERALAVSLDQCRRQGNRLYPVSPRSLVGSLVQLLGHPPVVHQPRQWPNPFEFLGADLKAGELIGVLDVVEAGVSGQGLTGW